MNINSAGLALIKKFEGFRAEPYKDPVGVLTIGYGHVVLPGESWPKLTEVVATGILIRDCALRGDWIMQDITAPLTSNQFSALVSLVYNVGTGPLHGKLAKRLNSGDIQGAADCFLDWDHAGGKVMLGLTLRRHAERELFLTEG